MNLICRALTPFSLFAAAASLWGCTAETPTESQPDTPTLPTSTQQGKITSTSLKGWVSDNGYNTQGDYDFLVNVDGHVKGEASNVYGACTGILLSPTVAITARHCLAKLENITVKVPFSNNKSFKADNAPWVSCGNEWSNCSFSGRRDVRYGANGSYYIRTLVGGTACSNDVFGDPAPGQWKNCAIIGDETSNSSAATFPPVDRISPNLSFPHRSSRMDVGVIILPSWANLSLRKAPVVASTQQYQNIGQFFSVGRVSNGSARNNDFAVSVNATRKYPAWITSQTTNFGGLFTPGSIDEYLFTSSIVAEFGDSGGPCMSSDSNGNPLLYGMNITNVKDQNGNYMSICSRLDVIKGWLDKINQTSWWEFSDYDFFWQYNDYWAYTPWDIWRMVQ